MDLLGKQAGMNDRASEPMTGLPSVQGRLLFIYF